MLSLKKKSCDAFDRNLSAIKTDATVTLNERDETHAPSEGVSKKPFCPRLGTHQRPL
jgi:hypothetical protein